MPRRRLGARPPQPPAYRLGLFRTLLYGNISIIWLITILFVLLYFQKYIDRQQVFKFLAGLRDEYDQVRCRILNIDPVPSLRKAFAIIKNEESRCGAMLPPIPSKRSALVSIPHS